MRKFADFFAAIVIAVSVTITASTAVMAASQAISTKTTLPMGTLFKFNGKPQVYYVAENTIAYPIPDEATFYSWFASFNKVKSYEQKNIGNSLSKTIITIKPGTRVIKFGSQPELYTVGKGARIRWIRDEATLVALFGEQWQNYFVNLNYIRRNDYVIGVDIKKPTDFDRAKERLGITPNDDLIARKVVVPSKNYAKSPIATPTQLKSLGENSTSALVPAFSPFTTSYKLTVPFREDKITLTPVAMNSNMKISVREEDVFSGKPIVLDVPLGISNIPITVESVDNEIEKYYLTIVRNKASENTYLSSLTENLSDVLSPKFSPATRDYVITATGKENVIKVVPKLQNSLSRLYIDGQEYPSGASYQKGLDQGNTNVIQFVILSESGVSDRYTITIKKPN